MSEDALRQKDSSIVSLVQNINPWARGWMIVDHWNADRYAIGIAARSNPDRLVYLSSWGKAPGRFFVELETPAMNEDLGYVATRIEDCGLSEVVEVLETHIV